MGAAKAPGTRPDGAQAAAAPYTTPLVTWGSRSWRAA